MSLYNDYLKIEDELEKMKFYFKNSMRYRFCKTRVSRSNNGVYLTDGYKKYFAEYSKVSSEFIRLFPVENNNRLGSCCKEIKLDDIVAIMKKHDEIINHDYKEWKTKHNKFYNAFTQADDNLRNIKNFLEKKHSLKTSTNGLISEVVKKNSNYQKALKDFNLSFQNYREFNKKSPKKFMRKKALEERQNKCIGNIII